MALLHNVFSSDLPTFSFNVKYKSVGAMHMLFC